MLKSLLDADGFQGKSVSGRGTVHTWEVDQRQSLANKSHVSVLEFACTLSINDTRTLRSLWMRMVLDRRRDGNFRFGLISASGVEYRGTPLTRDASVLENIMD